MITVAQKNNVDVVSFDGINKLNVLVAQQAKDDVLKVVNKPGAKIALNLEAINYIDSTGFGVLLSVLRTVKNQKGVFKICNVSTEVMELVKLLQLQNVFEIYDSIDACVASF